MFDFLKDISPAISTVGLLAMAIYVGFKEFKSGTNNVEQKTINAYKERNTQLEDEIPRLKDAVKAMGESIARLEGIVSEKDKHIKSLTDLLQGKNPEIVALLNDIKELNAQVISFMHTVDARTTKILDYQTSMIEMQVVREAKIDKGHQD